MFVPKITQSNPSALYIIQDIDLNKLVILTKSKIVQLFSNFLKWTWDFFILNCSPQRLEWTYIWSSLT